MSEGPVWIKEKGELQISGKRHTALDAQTLCGYLDSLVGASVAEVIVHNLEYRLGKVDAARIKMEKKGLTLSQVVDYLAQSDSASGFGITKVTLTGNPPNQAEVEVSNPSVKGTSGAAKSLLSAWWAGVLTSLLGKEFDVKHVAYDEQQDTMKCLLTLRT